jgi:erythromycin esterase
MPALAGGDGADMGHKVCVPTKRDPKWRRGSEGEEWVGQEVETGCFAGEHADLELDCGGEWIVGRGAGRGGVGLWWLTVGLVVCPILVGQVGKTRSSSAVPSEVTAWMKSVAIPLEGTSPEGGVEDMEALGPAIGDARIVAMGEETHGTHEFFQLKHRMLKYLVEKKGFTVFGLEANWPESLAINDYVVNGNGDPAEALDGLYFWTWNTEEMLDMIRWMRKYNADGKHTKKVKFFGFDMQVAHAAARNAEQYLEKVDPAEAKTAAVVFAPVSDAVRERESATSKPKVFWQKMEEHIEYLIERFESRKKVYVEASSPEQWTLARHNLEIVRQAAELYSVDQSGSISPRDQAMAENVKWILDQEGPEAKMMLWAHNGHVSTAPLGDGESMGMALRKVYGAEMVVCGLSFGQGSFQALQKGKGLREFKVGAAMPGSLDATLAGTGIPVFAIDLRNAPTSGVVGGWLNLRQVMRSIGAIYKETSPDTFLTTVDRHSFDMIFFVNRTTATRENVRSSELEFRGGD